MNTRRLCRTQITCSTVGLWSLHGIVASSPRVVYFFRLTRRGTFLLQENHGLTSGSVSPSSLMSFSVRVGRVLWTFLFRQKMNSCWSVCYVTILSHDHRKLPSFSWHWRRVSLSGSGVSVIAHHAVSGPGSFWKFFSLRLPVCQSTLSCLDCGRTTVV